MNIYFLEISIFSFLPMLLFRLMGYKTYFLDCGSPFWKKENIIRILSRISLIWLNHMEYPIDSPGKSEHDLYVNTMRIGNQVCSLEGYKWLVKAVGTNAVLQTCVYQRIANDLSRAVELLHTIPTDSKDANTSKAEVWVSNTLIIRSFLSAYPGVSNRCPRVWTLLELFFRAVGKFTAKVPKFVSIILSRFGRRRQNVMEGDNTLFKKEDQPDLQDYEVAYFPHQGVAYGGFFLKDHFYSNDQESPFFYEKIIHFEHQANLYMGTKSLEFYQEKNIRNESWQALPFKKKVVAKNLFSFFGHAVRHGVRGLDFDLLIRYAWIVWAVQSHRHRLRNLPKLKIILIGYDILFPQTLAAACRLEGIQTIAVQERMLSAWITYPSLIDHYFIIGPDVRRQLESSAPFRKTLYGLGPVRLKDHAKASAPDVISGIREKYSWVVLALDFHSVVGWFDNGRARFNNWRSNMTFYNHLLKLCHDFPDAFFLLKGKNTSFLEVHYFKDLVSRVRAQENLLLLEDFNLWTPFASVASADIAVVRHTSLADEMMALGKPVIFDDYDGFPSEIYEYGPDVTAYSYTDIRDKLARFFADPATYNANLHNLRKNLYYVPDQPVEQFLQRELMAIWKACLNNEQTRKNT